MSVLCECARARAHACDTRTHTHADKKDTTRNDMYILYSNKERILNQGQLDLAHTLGIDARQMCKQQNSHKLYLACIRIE